MIGIGLSLANPRGGGFIPTMIAGLQVALVGDNAPSGNVASWPGSYGTTPTATQSTGSLQPLRVASALNGHAVVRFDGTDDWLDLGNLSATFPTAATLFVVGTISGGDTSYCFYESNYNPAPGLGVADGWWRFSGTGNAYLRPFRHNRIENAPAAPPTTGTHIWSIRSSSALYMPRLDRAVWSTADYGAHTFEPGLQHAIGRGAAGDQYLNGDIAEVLVYNSVLSAGDVARVEDYLASKYAI